MEQIGAWAAGAVACLILYVLFDLLVTGFLQAIFGSGWGKRGRRTAASLRERHPDAVMFLIGPMGGPGVAGSWYAVVVDERGIEAYRATGRVAWSEPWSAVHSVTVRHGLLVIDRGADGLRSIVPKTASGEDVRGAELSDLVRSIERARPVLT